MREVHEHPSLGSERAIHDLVGAFHGGEVGLLREVAVVADERALRQLAIDGRERINRSTNHWASTRATTLLPTPPFSPPMKWMRLMRLRTSFRLRASRAKHVFGVS